MPRIQIKRGLDANVPTAGMLAGEQHFATDRAALYVAVDATTTKPVVTPIDKLANMGAVNGAADFIMIHDADEAGGGIKEKRITFNDFKTALAIPAGSSDEKVAVVSGGTPGYIWGTNGTDGILRMNTSMTWTKDAGNGFVTLAVNTVDCGTF